MKRSEQRVKNDLQEPKIGKTTCNVTTDPEPTNDSFVALSCGHGKVSAQTLVDWFHQRAFMPSQILRRPVSRGMVVRPTFQLLDASSI